MGLTAEGVGPWVNRGGGAIGGPHCRGGGAMGERGQGHGWASLQRGGATG